MKCTSLSLSSGAGGGASSGQSIVTAKTAFTITAGGILRYLCISSILLRGTRDAKPKWVAEKTIDRANKTGKDKPKIAYLELAFESELSDLQELLAIEVVKALLDANITGLSFEPNITSHPYFTITSFEDALIDADIIAILVGHKECRSQVCRDLPRNAQAIDFFG